MRPVTQVTDPVDDFVEEQNAILAAISQKELNQLAGEHLNMDDMLILVVGDKQVILPGLQELGYEVIELDTNGDPI